MQLPLPGRFLAIGGMFGLFPIYLVYLSVKTPAHRENLTLVRLAADRETAAGLALTVGPAHCGQACAGASIHCFR